VIRKEKPERKILKYMISYIHLYDNLIRKYDKQDQQGQLAFNERNSHTTEQQEPVARSPDGPQTKAGQGTMQNRDRLITKLINNL
jgi:hypothetical protein